MDFFQGASLVTPGRKEARFEEQVRRDSEQQLANNIGGREEGRQHKDCHHHVGALAADGLVIHDARAALATKPRCAGLVPKGSRFAGSLSLMRMQNSAFLFIFLLTLG